MKLDTNSAHLQCPECIKKNLESKMHIQAEHVTAKPNVFWEKDGRKHFHIVDVCLETIKCSNGHTFMQVSSSKCDVCGWTSLEFLKMLIMIAEKTGQIANNTV